MQCLRDRIGNRRLDLSFKDHEEKRLVQSVAKGAQCSGQVQEHCIS